MTSTITAAVPDMVSLLEEINTAKGTRNVAIDLANKFLPNPIRKEQKKPLSSTREGQEYTVTALSRTVVTLLLSVSAETQGILIILTIIKLHDSPLYG
jgi:hypothetical protein